MMSFSIAHALREPLPCLVSVVCKGQPLWSTPMVNPYGQPLLPGYLSYL